MSKNQALHYYTMYIIIIYIYTASGIASDR